MSQQKTSKQRGRGNRSRSAQRGQKFSYTPTQLAARAAALPVVTYPDLPVSEHRQEISDAIANHQVVIVAGETGSGKTTQLPKICLELGRGVAGIIGHTQPRRIAARAVAERIADELGQTVGKKPGDVIGYQVRFTDEVGPTTLIKLMTDGILLAEMGFDPDLRRYDTIILDEAHERSLNIDFIIGYLSRLLPRRPDLKVIVTSATIDSQRFADHFEKYTGTHVPVIEVSGRAYPVEVRYRPLSPDVAPVDEDGPSLPETTSDQPLGTYLHDEDEAGELAEFGYGLGEDLDVETALAHAVDELLAEPRGDILVFLPGERDIIEARQTLADHLGDRYVHDPRSPHRPNGVEILPLFARLSSAEQHQIYAPHNLQRIILATNIAETSLTVPGIRYVIDVGLARISRFSSKTKVQRLPIEPVSQASAGQRAGRSGRTSPGVAIRLYSRRDLMNRPRFTEPEILRTSLASVILQMSALGLGEVKNFPFLDAPNPRAVRDGVQLLVEIGALTDEGAITPLGKRLAALPMDPRLGRMLVEADKNGTASEVLVIVAALSIQDPRERPVENQEASDAAHRRYADPKSDFITYLNLWRYLNLQSEMLSGSAFRRMCRNEYLHYLRFRQWRDVVNQLRQMCRQVGIKVHPLGGPTERTLAAFRDEAHPEIAAVLDFGAGAHSVDADEIHRAILSGLLSNIGSWDEPRRDYAGARGSHFTIWPGSSLRRARPDWVMAAELVETSRLFARTVAAIKPEWVEVFATDLVRRDYSEPVWSRARGSAQVKEKVMLYGLTLVADRMVPLTSLGNKVIGVDYSTTATQAVQQALVADAGSSGAGAKPKPGPLTKAQAGAQSASESPLTARSLAREMFLTSALVDGDWRENHHAFVRHNKEVMEEAERLAERMRDPSLVPDESVRYSFFASRVPEHVTSAAAFNKWWKTTRLKNPHLLDYSLEELLPSSRELDTGSFPLVWKQGDLELPLDYSFSPGANEDGVTVTIPLHLLGRVKNEGFDWLVPGLVEEMCVALIRALPKAKRRFLAPATQTGKEIAQDLRATSKTVPAPSTPLVEGGAGDNAKAQAPGSAGQEADPYSLEASLGRLRSWGSQTGQVKKDRDQKNASQAASAQAPATAEARTQQTKSATPLRSEKPKPQSFLEAFGGAIRNKKGVELSNDELRAAIKAMPAHLRIGFRVVDERGAIVGFGESLPELQKRLAAKTDSALHSAVREALQQAQAAQGTPSKHGAQSKYDAQSKHGAPGKKSAQTGDKTPSGPPSPRKAQLSPGNERRDIFADTDLLTNNLAGLPENPLPTKVETHDATGLLIRGYPALVRQTSKSAGAVGVRVRSSLDEAKRDHFEGLVELLLRDLSLDEKRITTRWTGRQALLLSASPYPSTSKLVSEAQYAAARALLQERTANTGTYNIRDAAAYASLLPAMKNKFEDRVYETLSGVVDAVSAFALVEDAAMAHPQPTYDDVRKEAMRHARRLFREGYLRDLSPEIIMNMPRYLRADAQRIERATRGASELAQDRAKAAELAGVQAAYNHAKARFEERPFSLSMQRQLGEMQFLLEELRVSLFAQSLGAARRVSAARLTRSLNVLEHQA